MTTEKKVAVVTGASRGIGLATAETLAEAGYRLALAARSANEGLARAIATRFQTEVHALACDVRDEQSVREFFESVRQQYGRVNLLFNNAGIAAEVGNVEQLSVDHWRETLETNLTGTFLTTRYALPLMDRSAVIVNNLSVAAKAQFPGASAYTASKWGALGFTNTLREELRERGIRVVALLPGATNTDVWDRSWPNAPKHKMIDAKTIASAVLYAAQMPENANVDEITISRPEGPL